jgi:hypothetical protein
MFTIPQKRIFIIENDRLNMIGSIKNWEKVLYQDVAIGGMSYEQAKEKYNYNKYLAWGKKRFDQVYEAYREIYLSARGTDNLDKNIIQSTEILYIVMALAIGLSLAFLFIKFSK